MALDELIRTIIKKAFTALETKWTCIENNTLLTNERIAAEKLVRFMSKAVALLAKEVATWRVNEVELASIVHSSVFWDISICYWQIRAVVV